MDIKEKQILINKSRREANAVASQIPLYTQETRRLKKLVIGEFNEEAVAAAQAFLDWEIDPPLLMFLGEPGVGKTTLAWSIAWEYIEDTLSVRYWQVEELLNQLQAAIEDGREFDRIWTRIRTCDLLILDDLGAHNPTKWRESQLDAMIDFRYRERAPLIMTANVLEISTRVLDRIKEGRTAIIKGKSWRGDHRRKLA